ncbi:hypothetical protein [uncultured Croceitalea sp.]|uniref:hypothetical protein n=1 Tax=uncultured Croceitalea sp. TaxID=1798908 RepID=UPI003305DF2D
MNTFRSFVFIITIFSISINANSQIAFGNIDEGGAVSFVSKPKEIDQTKLSGSPYLEEDFKFGQIFVKEEKKIQGKLRYNAFNSELEIQKNDYEYSSILKRTYISAKIGDDFYKIYGYLDANGNQRTAYFIAKNEGEIKLLFKPEIKLKSARPAATNYDRDVPATFIDISSYYIVIDGKPAEKIRLKKRDIFEQLKDYRGAKEYVKQQDLKLNKVNDIVKLLSYLNKSI